MHAVSVPVLELAELLIAGFGAAFIGWAVVRLASSK
jgi:hypothetical protein